MIERPDRAADDTLALAQRQGWPPELCVLIERYPREVWTGHRNLGETAQFWLQRHGMFRDVGRALDDATTQFRDGRLSAADYPRWFVPRLQFFLQNLEGHHQIEDHHYFPVFRTADNRLTRGFVVLENDHEALHANIGRSVETANDMLRALAGSDADALRRSCDAYAAVGTELLRGLLRHLDDEEDLVVPLILDRGEAALGIGH